MVPKCLAQGPVSSRGMRSQTAYKASRDTRSPSTCRTWYSSSRSRSRWPRRRRWARPSSRATSCQRARRAARHTRSARPAFCRATRRATVVLLSADSRSAAAATARRRRRRRGTAGQGSRVSYPFLVALVACRISRAGGRGEERVCAPERSNLCVRERVCAGSDLRWSECAMRIFFRMATMI